MSSDVSAVEPFKQATSVDKIEHMTRPALFSHIQQFHLSGNGLVPNMMDKWSSTVMNNITSI